MDDFADLMTDIVAVYPTGYSAGVSGGAVRSDGSPVAMPASVQMLSADRAEELFPDQGDAVGSRMMYDVFLSGSAGATETQLAAAKAIKPGDTIATTADNPYPPITLRSIGPSIPVAGGQWYRVRCWQFT